MSADAATARTPVLIPTPAGFPVTWDSPDDQQLFWTQDRMHAPEALLPLDTALWFVSYRQINSAAADYEMPVRIHTRCLHGYLYTAAAPAVPLEQMEAQAQRSQERLTQAMVQLEASWKNEWLPEIKSHLDWWQAFDLKAASNPELSAHLRESVTRLDRIWHIHFLIVFPAYVAMSEFDEMYRDLFGTESAFDAYRLLQGLDNKTLETGRALWELSRRARALPDIEAVIRHNPPAAILAALEATSAGRAFKGELDSFLSTYGLRGDKWGVSYPSWIEDPSAVLKNLKDYVSQRDLDLEGDQATLAAERDRAIAEAQERLQGYPEPVREQFSVLLKAAQVGTILSEDHGFWIDFSCSHRVRSVFRELGRRLAEAGALASADDVFYLTLEEAFDVEGSLRNAALRFAVTERKAEVDRCRRLSAPPVLGTDYGPPPDDAVSRFMTKFFGGPPPASDVPSILKGHAGSPGKVRGIARVICSLDEADRLKPGDILVADTTAPPWTPLFATAGGIVTDTGGILSHCAVVAREYRIPAVVGTGRATTMIQDGQLIDVDGDSGTVQVVGS